MKEGNAPAGAPSQSAPLLSDRVRKAIADEITAGALKPGTPLDEQQLADRFGLSRTPVREALRQLAAAGMVELRPRRGGIVASLSPARIMDMFEMSAEMEAMCVRLAAYRMNPIERGEIRRLHEESAALVEAGDIEGYDEFNWKFHELIYRATHNLFLAEQAMALRDQMAAFRRAQLRELGRPEHSRNEHEAIMVAIMQSDGDEAARRMREHMSNASIALERYIQTQSKNETV